MINRKLAIIVSLVTIALIGLGIFGLFFTDKQQTSREKTSYVDPVSGKEFVGNVPLTQSDVDNPDPDRPTFVAFSTLSDRGLSKEQQTQVENALYSFSGQKSLTLKEFSLAPGSIETTPPGSDTPGYYMNFDVTANRKEKYYVHVTYTDFTSCHTEIYTADQQTLLFSQ